MDKDLLTLSKEIGTMLQNKNMKLASVESCTGGAFAKLITDIPGASQWFECGLVTYSNTSKTTFAGVDADLIAQQGAVSQKVALAMAKGAIDKTTADIAVSTTGIAGPDGGTQEKPVGTVCFGFATKTGVFSTDKQVFKGNRDQVRTQSIQHCLQCLRNYLISGHF